ncbi:hypothetical protein PFISCL1PPCAC_23421, partial [Pristionchus fissidentatus]
MGACSSSEVSPATSLTVSLPEKNGAPQPLLYLTEEEKKLLEKHFRGTLLIQRPEMYHKTMLSCINASPKMNEIIACQQYCMRDLTKWPKLNKIFTLPTSNMDSNRTFSTFGDSNDSQLERLSLDSEEEKSALLKAFSTLNEFIVDALYSSFYEEKKL